MLEDDRDKGNIQKIQEGWQNDFFNQLKQFSPGTLNNKENILAINADNQSSLVSQKQNNIIDIPIENEENTLRGTINEILNKKKNRNKTKPKQKNKQQDDDEDSPKKIKKFTKSWTKEETIKFYKGLKAYGINFQMISDYMQTKSSKQVRQKYNRESKQNKILVDDKLKYYDQNGQKKARKIIGTKINQLRKLNSQLSSQRSIEQLSQQQSIPLNQLSKSESTNSAFDFMDQQVANYCSNKIKEKQEKEEQKLKNPENL